LSEDAPAGLRAQCTEDGNIRVTTGDGVGTRRYSLRAHTGLDGCWVWPRVTDGPDGVAWLLAANLGSSGAPLPGHAVADALPCQGDGLELPIRWRGRDTIEVQPERPIRLRAEVHGAGARLFGLPWDVAPR